MVGLSWGWNLCFVSISWLAQHAQPPACLQKPTAGCSSWKTLKKPSSGSISMHEGSRDAFGLKFQGQEVQTCKCEARTRNRGKVVWAPIHCYLEKIREPPQQLFCALNSPSIILQIRVFPIQWFLITLDFMYKMYKPLLKTWLALMSQ